jgi:hypothetical protein
VKRLAIVIALLFALIPAAASAHTRSESHSSWTLDGQLIHMSFSVAEIEVDRLTPGRPVTDAALLGYLKARIGVTSNGTACPLGARPKMLAAAKGFRRAEFQFLCPSSTNMVIANRAFFDLVPSHIHMAEIQRPDGEFVEQLMTAEETTIKLDEAGGNNLGTASFFKFIEMGVMHIFTGIDHISFLIGLVLISRRLRDLVFVVTGFTIGHSLTLALAVTGVIRPHAEFIDALVALTIALIGAENVALASRRPGLIALWVGSALVLMAALRLADIGLLPPLLLIGAALFASCYLMVSGHLSDAGRIRLVVTLVFGLIHGFGFAADLLESRLPTEKLAEILVGFNLGVEIGQLTIVLLLTGLVALLVRFKLALPRPIVVDVAAAGLVAIGTFWFVQRSFA